MHLAFQGAPPVGLLLLSWLMITVLMPQVFSAEAGAPGYVRALEQPARLDNQPDTPGGRAFRDAWGIDIASRFSEFQAQVGTTAPAYASLPSLPVGFRSASSAFWPV